MKKYLQSLLKVGKTSLLSIDPDVVKNTTTVVLKNQTLDKTTRKSRGTYLGDVFKALPHGIINKTETGIGATTLELNALRNSIIVEPLKVTATTKAKKLKTLYVGSPTDDFPEAGEISNIEEYINDATIKYKKIIVVADSLYKVMKALGKLAYKNYFILIDDVDSFQRDSSFRESLELCMDTYKMFPIERRAMATATMLTFSDPDLTHESKVIIQYEVVKEKPINVIETNNLEGVCFDEIDKLSSAGKKIMIAYNNVQGCLNIAEDLVDKGVFGKEEIAILCGNNIINKNKIGEFFKEIDSEKLPCRVNFITAAYFSGFDISESYHLYSISNPNLDYSRLSSDNLKQIYGRCRKVDGILSNTLVYKPFVGKLGDKDTKEEMFEIAEAQLQPIKCINLAYDRVPKDRVKVLREYEKTAKNYTEYFKYVRKTMSDHYVISYFNIDAHLENQNTKQNYKSEKTLFDLLRIAKFEIKSVLKSASSEISSKLIRECHLETFKRAAENINKHGIYINYYKEENDIDNKLELEIYELFCNYRWSITEESLLNAIKESLTPLKKGEKSNNSRFKKLCEGVCHYYKKDKDKLSDAIKRNFPLNEIITSKAKIERFNNVLAEADYPKIIKKVERDKLLSIWLKLRESKSYVPGGKNVKAYKITSYNPYDLVAK